MLDAFIEGVKEVNPEAEVQVIRLYDYKFTGCRNCFACQLKNHRDDLQCWIKDDMTQPLKDTYHADGFRVPAKAKWQRHEERFETDLENARQAGRNMAAKFQA